MLETETIDAHAAAHRDRRVHGARGRDRWIRQQENQQLGVPREVAATFSPRLRKLCGYGVYNGLIGHINKRDPVELLDRPDPDGHLIWESG